MDYKCPRCGRVETEEALRGHFRKFHIYCLQPECLGKLIGYVEIEQEEEVVPERVVEEVADATANVIKKGENVMFLTLRRDPDGLKVSIKTHPAVESFFKGLGNGTTKNLALYDSKYWKHVPGEEVLNVYHSNGPFMTEGNKTFRLDDVGGKLQDENGVYNLAFLRFVGTSSGAGVSFIVKGVYSLDKLRTIRDGIAGCVQNLYRDYIKTTDLVVVVSTQEV